MIGRAGSLNWRRWVGYVVVIFGSIILFLFTVLHIFSGVVHHWNSSGIVFSRSAAETMPPTSGRSASSIPAPAPDDDWMPPAMLFLRALLQSDWGLRWVDSCISSIYLPFHRVPLVIVAPGCSMGLVGAWRVRHRRGTCVGIRKQRKLLRDASRGPLPRARAFACRPSARRR